MSSSGGLSRAFGKSGGLSRALKKLSKNSTNYSTSNNSTKINRINNTIKKNHRGINIPPRVIYPRNLWGREMRNSKPRVIPAGRGRPARPRRGSPPSYKKGGLVRKTGVALVHKGELVIPRRQVAMVRRAIRMYKRRTK